MSDCRFSKDCLLKDPGFDFAHNQSENGHRAVAYQSLKGPLLHFNTEIAGMRGKGKTSLAKSCVGPNREKSNADPTQSTQHGSESPGYRYDGWGYKCRQPCQPIVLGCVAPDRGFQVPVSCRGEAIGQQPQAYSDQIPQGRVSWRGKFWMKVVSPKPGHGSLQMTIDYFSCFRGHASRYCRSVSWLRGGADKPKVAFGAGIAGFSRA